MTLSTGEMTITDPETIVRTAINHRWTAEQLAQSFNGMPLNIARDLLNGTCTIDQEGCVHPS